VLRSKLGSIPNWGRSELGAQSGRRNPPACQSVCHTSEQCKNSCTDRDAVWLRTWVGPGNHVLDGGPDGKGQF